MTGETGQDLEVIKNRFAQWKGYVSWHVFERDTATTGKTQNETPTGFTTGWLQHLSVLGEHGKRFRFHALSTFSELDPVDRVEIEISSHRSFEWVYEQYLRFATNEIHKQMKLAEASSQPEILRLEWTHTLSKMFFVLHENKKLMQIQTLDKKINALGTCLH